MKSNSWHSFLLLSLAGVLLLAAAAPLPASAQSGEALEGSFLVGFRSVDVNGAERKYREDIDLEDGPRLFEVRLRFQPENSKAVDRVFLNIDNFGGDPFETLNFSAQKFGAYKLRYNRRASEYFYEDIILPHELADVRLSSGGDFHHFDLRRVHDTAKLDIDLSRAATLRFGFDRYTRVGESTTTLDVSRDEFELDRPIDESMNDYRAGFEYAWDNVTLTLEERYRTYDGGYNVFLPGFSLGENTDPASASLDFFFQDQPYDTSSNDHIARIVARPNKNLLIRGAVMLQNLEMEYDASERSQGISFSGQPFTTDATGFGGVDRDAMLANLDLVYNFNPRFAWTARVWQRDLDQEGRGTFDGDLGLGEWQIEATGLETGVQYQVSSALSVSGGVRHETREVDSGFAEGASSPSDLELESEETDHTGFFATLGWRPHSRASLTLTVEDSSYDDPYTLVSPTESQKIRLNTRWQLDGGFHLSGSYLLRRVDNDDSGWAADTDQLTLRFGYTQDDLNVSLGYNRVELDRTIDQVVVTLPGFGGGAELPFPIAYLAESDFIDGRLRWRANDQWSVGGDLRFYTNDGSFGLTRDDLRAFVEYAFPAGYLVRAGYRTVDYDEDTFDFDDYDADIAELAVGYRW